MYTVSQDKNGYWYVHIAGHPKTPVFGSFRRSKIAALQVAADNMGMSYGQYMAYRQKHGTGTAPQESRKKEPKNAPAEARKRKMPGSCYNCPEYDAEHYDMYEESICREADRIICLDRGKHRPGWCPKRENGEKVRKCMTED